MAQLRVDYDKWVILRSSIELIPLEVRDIDGVLTEDYTVCCVPEGTQPVTFLAPNAAGAVKGYLVNGPVLGVGRFIVYAKITGTPETPLRIATILYVW